MLNKLQENDILVVWRHDRLDRSMSHLIEIITQLQKEVSALEAQGFDVIADQTRP